MFVPGGDPVVLPEGEARLIKAGSDIIFQVHYTANGTAASDRSRIGLIFAKAPPVERVKTVRSRTEYRSAFRGGKLPAGIARSYTARFESSFATASHAFSRAVLRIQHEISEWGSEVLLRVPRYEFHWQQTYYLAEPRLLPKGTILIAKAGWDNSANNPNNPDPKVTVKGGAQSWDKMMAGFMDIALTRHHVMDFFAMRRLRPGRRRPLTCGRALSCGGL